MPRLRPDDALEFGAANVLGDAGIDRAFIDDDGRALGVEHAGNAAGRGQERAEVGLVRPIDGVGTVTI